MGQYYRVSHPPHFRRDGKPHLIQPPTIPQKARQNPKELAEQEKRILLAISALKKQEIRSIREAARIFNISFKTLHR